MKERITLTLERSVLQQVDSAIDRDRLRNRSHAIESLLSKALGANAPKKAFILAGGRGTRLRPITQEIPKPLVPLQGKPIMEHTIDLLKMHGIKDIIISIGYLGDKIKEHFGDGKRFGVTITYVQEDQPLGTGGPLQLAKHFLTETFIMCNADELKDINLFDMYNFHKENGAAATIALTTTDDPSAYGVAKIKGNHIIEFIEKPSSENTPSRLINSGLYILEPEVTELCESIPCSLEKDIFPKLAREGRLIGYPFSGQWFDTGTPERYEKAIKEWKGLKGKN